MWIFLRPAWLCPVFRKCLIKPVILGDETDRCSTNRLSSTYWRSASNLSRFSWMLRGSEGMAATSMLRGFCTGPSLLLLSVLFSCLSIICFSTRHAWWWFWRPRSRPPFMQQCIATWLEEHYWSILIYWHILIFCIGFIDWNWLWHYFFGTTSRLYIQLALFQFENDFREILRASLRMYNGTDHARKKNVDGMLMKAAWDKLMLEVASGFIRSAF